MLLRIALNFIGNTPSKIHWPKEPALDVSAQKSAVSQKRNGAKNVELFLVVRLGRICCVGSTPVGLGNRLENSSKHQIGLNLHPLW